MESKNIRTYLNFFQPLIKQLTVVVFLSIMYDLTFYFKTFLSGQEVATFFRLGLAISYQIAVVTSFIVAVVTLFCLLNNFPNRH